MGGLAGGMQQLRWRRGGEVGGGVGGGAETRRAAAAAGAARRRRRHLVMPIGRRGDGGVVQRPGGGGGGGGFPDNSDVTVEAEPQPPRFGLRQLLRLVTVPMESVTARARRAATDDAKEGAERSQGLLLWREVARAPIEPHGG